MSSSCPTPRKRSYGTRKEAKAEARRLRAQHSDRGRLHAYLCACGAFHLGTMLPWAREPREDAAA